MYSTCLFCHSKLGANQLIERFPIGSRLAFDSAKGRLWVVCPRCGRWNLTPVEERWEAVEDCERRFRGERLRQQTTNIGLVNLTEGLQLIRIGKPLTPEFAAWRYGQELNRRFRRSVAAVVGVGTLVTAGVGGLFAADILPASALPALGIWVVLAGGRIAYGMLRHPRGPTVVGPIRVPSGANRPFVVYDENAQETALVPADGENGWSIALVHARGRDTLTGDVASRALGVLLTTINYSGGSDSTVQNAAQVVGSAGADKYPARLARMYEASHARGASELARAKRDGSRFTRYGPTDPAALPNLPAYERLALEMAIHEHSEQRAIDGDLAPLEAAWREAEEIAAIADDLLLPDSARNLSRLRDK